jgi:hypothetical protein
VFTFFKRVSGVELSSGLDYTILTDECRKQRRVRTRSNATVQAGSFRSGRGRLVAIWPRSTGCPNMGVVTGRVRIPSILRAPRWAFGRSLLVRAESEKRCGDFDTRSPAYVPPGGVIKAAPVVVAAPARLSPIYGSILETRH